MSFLLPRRGARYTAFSLILFALVGCGKSPAAVSTPPVTATSSITKPQDTPAGQTTATPTPDTAPVPTYTYQVVNSYPHDSAAFTQGLLIQDGVLYESTGLNGKSSLRKDDLKTGRVLKKLDVPADYFAEGLADFKGKLYQLTWQAQKGFIYDPNTFKKLGEFAYTGEGWGLTHDGTSLILSDGSNQIRFIDPTTFKVTRTINVVDSGGHPQTQLNELEYIKGEIYANIWQTDYIVRIDPKTGHLLGWIDLSGLLTGPTHDNPDAVLNGIAYDAAADKLYVTGKLWPKLFEIRLKKQ